MSRKPLVSAKCLWVAPALVLLWAAGTVRADPTGDAPSPSVSARAARASDQAVADAQKIARTLAGALAVDSAGVQVDLRIARSAKKTIRAACLDGLLSQLHVTARAARERADALADAPTPDTLARELTRLEVLRERGKSLVLQARRCVDPGAALQGATDVRLRGAPTRPEPPLPAPQKADL